MKASNIIPRQGVHATARICRKILGDVKSKHNSLSLSRSKENIPPNVEPPTECQEFIPLRLGDCTDPQDAFDFDLEVYLTLKMNELIRQPSPLYFQKQTTIRPKMRAIVIDWLVDVHKKLKLHTDTLFTAVDIIDLFLSAVDYDKRYLQRLGCAALMIASKSEEISPPEAEDFVYFTKNSFTIKDLHETEAEIMKALDFRVNTIHSSFFMKRFLRIVEPSIETSMLAHYINEYTLLDSEMIGICPSLKAAAVICLVTWLRSGQRWDSELQCNTGFSLDQLRPIVNKLLNALKYAKSIQMNAIPKKYAADVVRNVSSIVFPDEFDC